MINEIYNILNGYEIDAREVHNGNTFIDSNEAEDIAKKIVDMLRSEMDFHINMDDFTCGACEDNLVKLNEKL